MTSQRHGKHKRSGNPALRRELFSNEVPPFSSRSGQYKQRAKNGKIAVLVAFLSEKWYNNRYGEREKMP